MVLSRLQSVRNKNNGEVAQAPGSPAQSENETESPFRRRIDER